jgi:hypothetical protein
MEKTAQFGAFTQNIKVIKSSGMKWAGHVARKGRKIHKDLGNIMLLYLCI